MLIKALGVAGPGSGKFGTPCVRMHWANLSMRNFMLSVTAAVFGPAPGSCLRHTPTADRKAGDCGSTPEPAPMATPPPPGVGSGKFGTPFDRMQLANARNEALLLALCDPDDPQAATATATPDKNRILLTLGRGLRHGR